VVQGQQLKVKLDKTETHLALDRFTHRAAEVLVLITDLHLLERVATAHPVAVQVGTLPQTVEAEQQV
jgi:hypothetical protein